MRPSVTFGFGFDGNGIPRFEAPRHWVNTNARFHLMNYLSRDCRQVRQSSKEC